MYSYEMGPLPTINLSNPHRPYSNLYIQIGHKPTKLMGIISNRIYQAMMSVDANMKVNSSNDVVAKEEGDEDDDEEED